MYINRELEKEIAPFLGRREVLAIIGPRQSGKTTLLNYFRETLVKEQKKVKFLTFENRADLALFHENLEDFRDLYKRYEIVIIDEFQYAKEGGKKLKYLFDTTETKFIISGSSSLELTFQTGKYMVGRMLNFTLLPFSFREYLSFVDNDLFSLLNERIPNVFEFSIKNSLSGEINKRLGRHFEQYLIWGGYPAVALAATEREKGKIIENVFESYLLRDIRSLLKLATEEELVTLIKFLATQIGDLVEYKGLSNVSQLSYRNLMEHLNILRQTYIIDLIKPYFTNKRTELSKNPKIYFIDLGFRNFALLDFRPVAVRNDLGSLAENYVYTALRRKSSFATVNFWRTKSKAEVDFIISKDQTLLPIEVKYKRTPTPGKSLHSFIAKFSPKEALVLTKGSAGEEKVKGCQLKFIPAYYL